MFQLFIAFLPNIEIASQFKVCDMVGNYNGGCSSWDCYDFIGLFMRINNKDIWEFNYLVINLIFFENAKFNGH